MKKYKIVHIITNLERGGAENMLYKLIQNSNSEKYEHMVISMISKGYYGSLLEKEGILVQSLEMKRGIPSVRALVKTLKICKNADIIQTWMYHADFLGAIVKLVYPWKRLIWGLRQSRIDAAKDTKSTIIQARINAILSFLPDIITHNAKAAVDGHKCIGYRTNKMRYTPNGVDTDIFKKSKINDKKMDETQQLITIGRWDKQKGYNNLLKSLGEIDKDGVNFHLSMCGNGLVPENQELSSLIKEYELEDKISLFGPRSQQELIEIMQDMDIFILPSLGEGFSNALAEAMSCELFPVVTNVGDSATIVGNTGIVVSANDNNSLTKGIKKAISSDRCKYVKAARLRIEDNYSIKKAVINFEIIYDELVR